MRILEGEKVTKHFGGLAAVQDVDFVPMELVKRRFLI
jgi:ABC-type branched-subunit amino acid transport system ATPase component